METQYEKLSPAAIKIDLAGDLDDSMSAHVSDTLDAVTRSGFTLVTISLRHIRKTCWGAVCAFSKTVRESREKGMDVRVADAQPRVALLLHAGGLPFAQEWRQTKIRSVQWNRTRFRHGVLSAECMS
jgi:hypothetical protein